MHNAQKSGQVATGPLLQHIFQTMTMWGLIAAALAAWLSLVLSASGVWPWLSLDAKFGATSTDIGTHVQVGFAVLLLGLCTYLPAVTRMLALERSHRSFAVTMDDVAKAYKLSHDADRLGRFALSSEFDAVRERLHHMRSHPDLARLEPEVIELAAQMSYETRDLAKVYSEDRIERARTFLKSRQQELDEFKDKLAVALATTDELKRWQSDVEASELEANRQMDVLEKDLREVLPSLGYELDDPIPGPDADDGNVVAMQSSAGASVPGRAPK